MTNELAHEIAKMNQLERDMRLMWDRGYNIPKELLEGLRESRLKIKELQEHSDNKLNNHQP